MLKGILIALFIAFFYPFPVFLVGFAVLFVGIFIKRHKRLLHALGYAAQNHLVRLIAFDNPFKPK
jgi:hypothetical protein